MRADNILDQIDAALTDHAIGPDAMRYMPDPPVSAAALEPGTDLQIQDSDGEWQQVPGVIGVDFGTAEPVVVIAFEIDDSALQARVREAHQAIRDFVEAMRPAIEEAGRWVAQAAEALRQAGVIDEDGKPVRRSDRPAWQSPYGPPNRRR